MKLVNQREGQQVELVVAVAVIRLARLVRLFILLIPLPAIAGVLPEDRADVLYHSYEGGGISITGPSVLVRKSVGTSFSLVANHYEDHISGASIDVITTASPYREDRYQQSVGVDYLDGKTLISLNFTNSEENDFQAQTKTFSISQDMFGDLTTVAMTYSRGDDIVGMRSSDLAAPVARQAYHIALTQVLTKNSIVNLDFETITDEGEYLNNPYRNVRYLDGGSPTGYSYQSEVYPNTRTSNAVAIRGKYFLDYRAALFAEYRFYADSWGIVGQAATLGYTQPVWSDWIFETRYRAYSQTRASFYSDLFSYQDAQNFLARDKELSTFTDHSLHLIFSYEFAKGGLGFINKGSANLAFTHIRFNYENFSDLRFTGYPVGQEPLYAFGANVLQIYASIWY